MKTQRILWSGMLALAAPVICAAGPLPSPSLALWDPLTKLDAPGHYLRGPVFDSLGNAWVVVDNGVNLTAHQSNGTSGTWKAPHIIGPSLPNRTYTVGLVADRAGGVYISYGTGLPGSGSFPLMWTKYTPAGGWRTPALIHTSPHDFTETFALLDSAGRMVIVFNANGVASVASTPGQTSWGPVQTIAPPPRYFRVSMPSVAANRSGTRLALVYWTDPAGLRSRGLRYAFFDSATGRWSDSQPIPGAENATFSSYSAENAFPVAVDEQGNVSLVCAILKGLFTVGGFRYEAGQWTLTQLLPWSRAAPDPATFGSTAIRADGTVLVTLATNFDADTTNVSVFRHTPGQGWRTEVAATYKSTIVSRCAVAWFNGDGAVVVYQDYSGSAPLLRAAVYANGVWASGPPISGRFRQLLSQDRRGSDRRSLAGNSC
jgi:hypothetical protein